jgi:endonuclease G
MTRPALLAALLALCLTGAAVAASDHDNADFAPGPQNDADTCSELWQGIGLPDYVRGDERDTTIVCHTKYVLSHNNAALGPDWVLEHLTAEQVSGKHTRPKLKFQHETLVPRGANDSDYVSSGFDRGHQAPSADFSENVDWMKESFMLSNIVPQVGAGFNRDIWATLEGHVRDLAIARGELYTVTGPVYPEGKSKITISAEENSCGNEIVLNPPARASICGSKKQCGDDGVLVPSAMFKLIYDPDAKRANVFLMPNINHRKAEDFTNSMNYIKKFQVSVRALEDVTNIEFLGTLPASLRQTVKTQCAAVMMR